MNVHDLVLQVLEYLIGLGIATLVPIVAHYVLEKAALIKQSKYAGLADVAVKAAQIALPEVAGLMRREDAVSRLSQMTKGKLTEEDLNHLIDSAYFDMRNEIGKLQPIPSPIPVVEQPVVESQPEVAPEVVEQSEQSAQL